MNHPEMIGCDLVQHADGIALGWFRSEPIIGAAATVPAELSAAARDGVLGYALELPSDGCKR